MCGYVPALATKPPWAHGRDVPGYPDASSFCGERPMYRAWEASLGVALLHHVGASHHEDDDVAAEDAKACPHG